jgi:hypothetical protein
LSGQGTQALVYQMEFASEAENAMIGSEPGPITKGVNAKPGPIGRTLPHHVERRFVDERRFAHAAPMASLVLGRLAGGTRSRRAQKD